MHIVLETPRLFLRRFTEADAALLLELNSDPEVLKYVHEAPLETTGQALEVIRNIILPQYKNNLGRWAIHRKEDQVFLGWSGLKYVAEKDEIDLGYRLMKKYWGKGYATEAAQACLHYGFEQLHLPLITAHAHTENLASRHVIEKIGMQFARSGTEDNCPVHTYTKANPSLNPAS
ncbi:MAG: GNAT family N-acetyltransferase [Ferruginibacter sp.]